MKRRASMRKAANLLWRCLAAAFTCKRETTANAMVREHGAVVIVQRPASVSEELPRGSSVGGAAGAAGAARLSSTMSVTASSSQAFSGYHCARS